MRCLIIDDSPYFCGTARATLERGGFTIIGAVSNSAAALRCYTRLRPDITLIDVDLGSESGFELAAQLHQAGQPQPPPLILMSTYAEEDIAEMIAAAPVVGFLAKADLSAHAVYHLLTAHHHNSASALNAPAGTSTPPSRAGDISGLRQVELGQDATALTRSNRAWQPEAPPITESTA